MKERVPSSEIKYKNESSLMKLLGKVLFFNKTFMTQYTTTKGTKVYFPNRKDVEAHPERYFNTLAHEYVHVWDANNAPIGFPIIYLLPQLLAILSLGAFLAFINTWFLLFLIFLVFLAPIPSPGRAWAELRGYGMSCKVRKWKHGHVSKDYLDSRVETFAGSAYYFMWPFKSHVRRTLQKYIDTDECLNDKNPAYRDVYELVK
jgi:hypothetical protein